MKKNTNRTGGMFHRRDVLKLAAAGGLGFALGNTGLMAMAAQAAPTAKPLDTIRVGFVGVGRRSNAHLSDLLKLEGVEVRAVCDVIEGRVAKAQEMVVAAGKPKPDGYSRGETDFRRLCDRNDLDVVYTATPWEWHVPVCLAAMNAGKHAATEVPAAVTLEECWQLVDTSEKTGKYCVILENCCYDRVELMALNMVRKGLLGELTHAECGYLHDLRKIKLDDKDEGFWRRAHSERRNGDLYPTHGLGPVAQCMNINRGNQFTRLVSMSSQSRGMKLFAAKEFGKDSPKAKANYALGDVVTTLIQTAGGQTIVVTHDTNSPRPYSRDILVQGTKGLVQKYPEPKVYIEGVSKPHAWDAVKTYEAEYDHPLWKQLEEKAKDGGHGGIDSVMNYRLIHCLRTGEAPDMDVYDAAAWSAVSALSEKSIAGKNIPVDFPDFTRGAWKNRQPLGIVSV